MMLQTGSGARGWLLIYDGKCPLCRRFMGMVSRFDRDGRITTITHDDYGLRHRVADAERFRDDVQLIGPDGAQHTGGAAIHCLVSLLPALKPFRWMLEGRAGRKLSDLFYFSTSRLRRCLHCGEKRDIRRR